MGGIDNAVGTGITIGPQTSSRCRMSRTTHLHQAEPQGGPINRIKLGLGAHSGRDAALRLEKHVLKHSA